ncbi:hypothetical protein JTE90_004165 [Oedothorax gibbosus]|uniref:Galectin n=1 Tax=Oedothorax gibbosus TaxID=931172 RepID=A0AAV6TV09_9ARAC|nr:hypothetical protein JTE90_004165 [Oedothorax gibbosus]
MTSMITRPAIPYRGNIPRGIHEGKVIEIRGAVPHGADVFTVNLLTGLDSATSDRPLHLSVRFGPRVAVRNHLERNAWGVEERQGPFPFQHGAQFTITIVAEATHYKISVNHQHCWQFNHRMPLWRVSSILIDGMVQIERIEFINRPGSCVSPPVNPPILRFNSRGGSTLGPVYNPPIPYAYPIYGGLVQGMVMHISGIPTTNAERFHINLQTGPSTYNIALHLSARFQCQTLVRNTCVSGTWEREERDLPRFPFAPGLPFQLCIRVQKNRFAVELDGLHLLTFAHRLRPISNFDTLFIERDVQVTCIRFE